MDIEALRAQWLAEEAAAHMLGWEFSHIDGRYDEEEPPWDYRGIVLENVRAEDRILDIDTGGGEFLLSLGHPAANTAATEGFAPNVALCREKLAPLGIAFREMADGEPIPFEDESFDRVIDRHGSFDIPELWRVLRPGGRFITQQVGDENDRGLVELLLPGLPKPFPGLNLTEQRRRFEAQGFRVQRGEEFFGAIRFFDIGALVWFARIIEWEFRDFSVEKDFDRLLEAQRVLEEKGAVEGCTHRYLIVAEKPR